MLSVRLDGDALGDNRPLLPCRKYWYAILPFGIEPAQLIPLRSTPDSMDWITDTPLLTPLEEPIVGEAVPGGEVSVPFKDL